MRADLLALSDDDLVLLANRGLLKRARRELEKGGRSFELDEDGATLTFRWDDATCVLPDAPLDQARCSCPALGACRHLVRSVLAYRERAEEVEEAPPSEPWDPGGISDEQLAQAFPKATLKRLRTRYEKGLVVELLRARKPSARFCDVPFAVRFLVPGDVRYSHCNCDERAPCSHAAFAVWAFRELAADKSAGLLETRRAPAKPCEASLAALGEAVEELVEAGLAGLPAGFPGRVQRLATRLRKDGLVWPAEIVGELRAELERYRARDARFAAEGCVDLLGELSLRCAAIAADTGAVPQLFLRGSTAKAAARSGYRRLVGLGCGVERLRASVRLTAYLHDPDSGQMLVLRKEHQDPEDEDDAPAPFASLAQRSALRGARLASVAEGLVQIQSPRFSAAGELLPGRSLAAVHPQPFRWEELRPPLFAEDFAEVAARLGARPPRSLRPRTLADDLCVVPLAAVEDAGFAGWDQVVRARLRDASGGEARLRFPYMSRGAGGCDALLAALRRPEPPRFIAARARLAGGLVLEPLGLVLEEAGVRRLLAPWIAVRPPEIEPLAASGEEPAAAPGYIDQLRVALAELLTRGLDRSRERTVAAWEELVRSGEAIGFARLVTRVEALAAPLRGALSSPTGAGAEAGRAWWRLAGVVCLARETG